MTCSGEGSKSVTYSIKNCKRSIDTLIKVLLYLLNGLIVTLTHSGIYAEYFTDHAVFVRILVCNFPTKN